MNNLQNKSNSMCMLELKPNGLAHDCKSWEVIH